ncbi:hypothetical protein LEP1GSC163_0139 [Leptospira santarosai str. CBC379]|uniref:hypothetical protein n=1 Tax=Leptospira santarosai TaxID=28183 RepID=UPI0002982C51|nr:hypothetical protein [Leptospira santarosai]EKR89680.1 hypothetical protein LEP1GSC163_0139 [Leptospira santarosai str. CBC379]
MNYILEKSNKQVVWINPDPNKLTGGEAWGEFNPSIHEIVHALNYNPQIGDAFLATVTDGRAEDFIPKNVYNRSTGVARVLFNWDDVIDPETETDDSPLLDKHGNCLPNQVYTPKGWIVDLEKLRVELQEKVNSICSMKIVSGFESDALGSAHYYDSSTYDQLNLIELVILNSTVKQKCVGVQDGATKEKTFQEHTAEQIRQVLADGAVLKSFYQQRAAALKKEISNARSLSELEQIKNKINEGWAPG